MIAASETSRVAFFKRTRKGKVVRFVREKYRRDDVGLGVLRGTSLDLEALQRLVEDSVNKTLVVVDTNIVLHEIDLLEQQSPVTALLVVTQTVLQELRHRNYAAFKRVRSLMEDETRSIIFYPNEASSDATHLRTADESVNDANDQAIVSAACVFQNALAEPAKVVFVTNDAMNRKRATSCGLESHDMRSFLATFAGHDSDLVDFLANTTFTDTASDAPAYPEHASLDEIQEGLRARKYFRGVLRAKRDDWTQCYVIVHDGNQRTVIQVEGAQNVNRALEGDIVAVELINPPSSAAAKAQEQLVNGEMAATEAEPTFAVMEGVKEGSQFGRIVGIVRRALRQCAGALASTSTASANGEGFNVHFIPVDKRLPRVLISTQRLDALVGQRLLVCIDSWPAASPLPCGHYIRTFGPIGDRKVENEVLLFELGVAHEDFSTAVLACLPPTDWRITEEEVARRTDLRHLPITSVDPPGCKDIDDALHAVRLPNGNYQVGVHIADVSHFLLPDSAMDKEAAQRCTSTYLVERRLDMLPELLTTRLCSLRCDEDHLTFSVLWEMDTNANIVDVSFCKSVIHSKASLSYQQAQDILDTPVPAKEPATHSSLRILNQMARILKQRRIEAGALTLASPEVRFKLDQETQNPLDVALYQLREANSMVEEWMLLANITVAKKTLQHFPTLSILRRHQPPSREQFGPLLQAAALAGVQLDISSSLALARSLDAAERVGDPFFNKLLRILSTRCMMPAQYFCSGELSKEEWHHYGLAAPVYTHFTSPIRRYADVLVHRLLAAAIGVAPLPNATADRVRAQEQSSQMNRRHRAAQLAQRASVHLYTLVFFKDRACVEEAYVLSVTEEKIGVLVPRYGFEGSLPMPEVLAALRCADSRFEAELACVDLVTPAGPRRISIFDRVKVSISTVEKDNNDRVLQLRLAE